MNFTPILHKDISRLTLGTVQLGLDYGIANATGKPSLPQAQAILDATLQGGINVIDTARAYGDSEGVLGKIFHQQGWPENLLLCTKLPQILGEDHQSSLDIEGQVRQCLDKSLEQLDRPDVHFYMLHHPQHMTAHNGKIMDTLRALKLEGRIHHIGVSIYSPQEALQALEIPDVEAIQIPFNVFDQRLRQNGFLDEAHNRGLFIFARSAFLQGLLLMDDVEVPLHLHECLPWKAKLRELLRQWDRTLQEAALLFPLTQEGITSIVVGVETAAQMRENLSLIEAGPLHPDLVSALEAEFTNIPEYVVNPSLWKKEN